MSGCQLTLKQRCRINAMNAAGHAQVAIARAIGASPSTVCRELKRNGAPRHAASGQGGRRRPVQAAAARREALQALRKH